MVPVLNQLGITAACYGNHDFDFGAENLVKLSEQTNFPWIMSNVLKVDADEVRFRSYTI